MMLLTVTTRLPGRPGRAGSRRMVRAKCPRWFVPNCTLRGTHLGELWDLPPTGNRVELEFIDIFRLRDGKLIEMQPTPDAVPVKRTEEGEIIPGENVLLWECAERTAPAPGRPGGTRL